ncbi:hypothetical protein Csa_006953 [Cucumis sativus]|uniref:Protein kinase domain-containing protein n=1 Tax=Cucumis sativus TaxID=3659 RepID=A0A0A0LXX1_CUCSA|nr:hypothetical protein Csa_006953 [Cucumis sativus]
MFTGKDTVLSWKSRVQILRDCALALRYLHQRVDGCIVHRDIKVTSYSHPTFFLSFSFQN